MNVGLSSEVEPLRIDRCFSGKQAQRRASQKVVHAQRLQGLVRIGKVDDHDVTGSHFVRRRGSGPMTRIDSGFQGTA